MPYPKIKLVGLLGGSFDPPHQGHVHISNLAIKLFELDEVWWIVSPGNPLKNEKPASYEERSEKAQSIIRNPRIKVSEFEYLYGIKHTCDTVIKLKQKYLHHRFVWLMGSDNLVQIVHWKSWDLIFDSIPIVVLSRTNLDLPGLASKAASCYANYYIPSRIARRIVYHQPPAWTLIKTPKINISSSKYRAKGLWKAKDYQDGSKLAG